MTARKFVENYILFLSHYPTFLVYRVLLSTIKQNARYFLIGICGLSYIVALKNPCKLERAEEE